MRKNFAMMLAGAVATIAAALYLATQAIRLEAAPGGEGVRLARTSAPASDVAPIARRLARPMEATAPAPAHPLSRYLPRTPDGWSLQDADADELAAHLHSTGLSQVRPATAPAGAEGEALLVRFQKGEKEVFMNLHARSATDAEPIARAAARPVAGAGALAGLLKFGGLTWEQRVHSRRDIVDLSARVGHDTALALFGYATREDIQELMAGMDLTHFAALRAAEPEVTPAPVESAAAPEKRHRPATLAEALAARRAAAAARAPLEEEEPSRGFRKPASGFASRCQSTSGAKFCSTRP